MIHIIEDRRVFIGVISMSRPENVETFPFRATWVVPADQMWMYDVTGATVMAEPPGPHVGPAAARNAVLDMADLLSADALIMDDDPIGSPRLATLEKPGANRVITPLEAIEEVVHATIMTGASLGSHGQVQNAFWVTKAIAEKGGGCSGRITYVPHGRASHLRQDENCVAEDFEFGVQHIARGTGFCRVNAVMWNFGWKGGITDRLGTEGWEKVHREIYDTWGPKYLRPKADFSHLYLKDHRPNR